METGNRRQQILDIVYKEFVGPDPINADGLTQLNGEEILSSDPPRIRYSAGILFPQGVIDSKADILDDQEADLDKQDDAFSDVDTLIDIDEKKEGAQELLQNEEELINLSNGFRQSAISVTSAVKKGQMISVMISAGIYKSQSFQSPLSDKKTTKYLRSQFNWDNDQKEIVLPTKSERIIKLDIYDKDVLLNIKFAITYRYEDIESDCIVYTFTLENSKKIGDDPIRDEDCFFQTEFTIFSKTGFAPLPEGKRVNNDDDFKTNQLLYRNVKNFASGHGCAADWEEIDGKVMKIKTVVFPSHEIKPIVPTVIQGVSLDMYKMSDFGDFSETIRELNLLCDKYKQWIENLKIESLCLIEFRETAERHISSCEQCYQRMRRGVNLLEQDPIVARAFKLMNRAMLLQQLHYNLPLQEWEEKKDNTIFLSRKYSVLPDVNDPLTWYNNEGQYGKWRPFQLAFILINLHSMADRMCAERDIVDLIWFPTGGGKTEAYLGLSAYSIFIRRLLDVNDSGTTILMRYTLRLLTTQQYERASSMICACEIIRSEKPKELGISRISIGLWVGNASTPNKMADAVTAYVSLYQGKTEENRFIISKCPWCGAQMGPVNFKSRQIRLPGYRKLNHPNRVVFQCSNELCDFSKDNFNLPLMIVDEDIYEHTPTLLLGTVDKFAMLPFRPEAQKIFGILNGVKHKSPDLIIQDELHLISGPLGSMVGHYETLIHELCSEKFMGDEIHPKIIASTATISHAKDQCQALYNVSREQVVQFPPPGIDAGDSFFSIEDKTKVGRLYVGVMASASSSFSMTNIRLYAALLYAAKELHVKEEKERDPYWTNLGYFNSLRELGQTATWVSADIDEYLHTIYKRRMLDKEPGYKENRRYIWRCEELTSRIRSDKVPMSLQNLSISYPSERDEKRPVDICLATNMISVGVDISRLGLMTVNGQPKTTSEYIQATSRVGRSTDAPGIIFTTYSPGKPRDRSHYEQFIPYHSRIYCYVEPTSVTPFSAPMRERALHAVLIGMIRLLGNENTFNDPRMLPDEKEINRMIKVIEDRVAYIDIDEYANTQAHLKEIIMQWENQFPQKYQDFKAQFDVPLMYPAGTIPNANWGSRGMPTPTSMRSVDSSCEVYVLKNKYSSEED